MTTETNAEFLERMQQKAYTKLIFLAVQVDMPDLKRLIQQAERAQELEQEKEFFRRSFVELKAGDVITRKENARLREALEFYADAESYEVNVTDQWGPVTPILQDDGRKAGLALKGESS